MKRTFTLFFLLLLSFSQAQQNGLEVVPENGSPFLLGSIDKSMFNLPPYADWYEKNRDDYSPQPGLVAQLSQKLDKHHVLIFLGTWCGDSKREVPRFIKILEDSGFPDERLKIVALDRREPNVKKSPTGEEWGLQIKRVPTFIFLKDGKEVNRIVESPIGSLEADMLQILNRDAYVPNYLEMMKSD